ncbi:transposase [Paucibacter sp. APW11]|uniref:Transposase n=1 Tax=Roseateles aquae TaxID=3077235 RepID=A0ABU3PIW6_9BURK|nr:transposase [Paucibacter sp. APW11]MDT9002477.1 transposase [Paucibacter sp. APW11]
MAKITRVGVDLAKRVYQVHAVDYAERPVLARPMSTQRDEQWAATLPAGTLVVMEACSGAHHLARRLRLMGLDAWLIAPHFIAPFRVQDELTASALVAAVCDMRPFKSARQFSAWVGQVPSHNSSVGKNRLGRITEHGDDDLRTLLIQGAKSALPAAPKRKHRISQRLLQLRDRVGWQKALVALAKQERPHPACAADPGARLRPRACATCSAVQAAGAQGASASLSPVHIADPRS